MRRAYALAAAASLALVLAGCGGGDSAEPQADAALRDVRQGVVNGGGAGTPVLDCKDLDKALPGAPAAAGKGDKLPDLSLKCLGDGAPVSLRGLKGPLVFNVWASWCRPCADEIAYLTAAHQALGEKVRFAGLALADQDADSRAWLSFYKVDWANVADPKGLVRGPLRVPGPPVTFFVNSAGTITEVHYGAFTSARQVQDAIAENLGVT